MKRKVVWVGTPTSLTRSLRENRDSFLNQESLEVDYKPNMTSFSHQRPDIILSEDFKTLTELPLPMASVVQILFCSSKEFWLTLSNGIRPLNRYYFLTDAQNSKDFDLLLSRLILEKQSELPLEKPRKSAPHWNSFRNSLGVLMKMNTQQIQELTQFSREEEERRQQFQSLIRLARSLSMSRDLEEMMKHLWDDLRTIPNIREISIIINFKNNQFQQITFQSGKFHFEYISSLQSKHRDFLDSLFHSSYRQGLISLSTHQIETISFIQKKTFKKLFIYSLRDQGESVRPFLLFLEKSSNENFKTDLEDQLHERLSIIKLTLEKHLMQEEARSKAHLWTSTFDDLNDPLAILSDKNIVIRANQRYLLDYDGELKLESPEAEIQIKNKIYHCRRFPIQYREATLPHSSIIHLVDVTTDRVLFSRLIQSEKMMAISRLAGDLTQALTLPLQTIYDIAKGVIEIKDIKEQTKSDLVEIMKASQRSLKIINDFIHFSKGHLEKSESTAESLVELTIPLTKSLIHGHRFQIQLSEVRHSVIVSTSLLQQALYNLLKNAHQSMPNAGIIRVTTQPRSIKNLAGVQITVIDSGKGVPEELRSKLFQPLVSNKGKDGTGLGLNIVKQIVESHNGMVGYAPNETQGSQFWIWLPLKSAR